MEIKRLYDLSTSLRSYMPLWPTYPNLKIEPVGTVPRDGYLVESFYGVTHSGTHVDAPAHMLENGDPIDKIPIDSLILPSFMIKLKAKGNEIDASEFEEKWDSRYDGKGLLINTGWYKKRAFTKEFQYDFPGLSEDAADFLIKKKIKLVGIDTLGIEPYSHKDFMVHKKILGSGLVIIEDLYGLDQLEESKEYLLVTAPLKIENGSGAPARVYAIEF